MLKMEANPQLLLSEVLLNTWVLLYGKHTWLMAIQDSQSIMYIRVMCFQWASSSTNLVQWKMLQAITRRAQSMMGRSWWTWASKSLKPATQTIFAKSLNSCSALTRLRGLPSLNWLSWCSHPLIIQLMEGRSLLSLLTPMQWPRWSPANRTWLRCYLLQMESTLQHLATKKAKGCREHRETMNSIMWGWTMGSSLPIIREVIPIWDSSWCSRRGPTATWTLWVSSHLPTTWQSPLTRWERAETSRMRRKKWITGTTCSHSQSCSETMLNRTTCMSIRLRTCIGLNLEAARLAEWLSTSLSSTLQSRTQTARIQTSSPCWLRMLLSGNWLVNTSMSSPLISSCSSSTRKKDITC